MIRKRKHSVKVEPVDTDPNSGKTKEGGKQASPLRPVYPFPVSIKKTAKVPGIIRKSASFGDEAKLRQLSPKFASFVQEIKEVRPTKDKTSQRRHNSCSSGRTKNCKCDHRTGSDWISRNDASRTGTKLKKSASFCVACDTSLLCNQCRSSTNQHSASPSKHLKKTKRTTPTKVTKHLILCPDLKKLVMDQPAGLVSVPALSPILMFSSYFVVTPKETNAQHVPRFL